MARPPANGPAKPAYFTIATGSTVGSYFPVGSGIATILSHPSGSVRCEVATACGPAGLVAVAVASPGSVSNVHDVALGKVDSALAPASVAAWAYMGTQSFRKDGPYKSLRAIARLYPEAVHLVARKGAGIHSISDLKRRRVGVDVEGSATHAAAAQILAAAKLGKKSFDSVQASDIRAAELLASKQLDAFFVVAAAPIESVRDLAEKGLVELVSISGSVAKSLTAQSSYFVPEIVPAGTYPGIARTETIAIGALWVVNASADETLVYQLTSALWDPSNRVTLMRGTDEARNMSLAQALSGVTIPLHKGAERFYVEKGLMPREATEGKQASAGEGHTGRTR